MINPDSNLKFDNGESVKIYLRTELRDKQRGTCPHCNRTMTRKIEINEIYSMYKCWNKDCREKKTFIVINKYMHNEYKFDLQCSLCGEDFIRKFNIGDDIYLSFLCHSKLCGMESEPFTYNLTQDRWEGNIPKFETDANNFKLPQEDIDKIKTDRVEKRPQEVSICNINQMPLLTMNRAEYHHFLSSHNDRVAVLVDVPNFIRTLREINFKNFTAIVKRTPDIIASVVSQEFGVIMNYTIDYYSNPSEDLIPANQTFRNGCVDSKTEFFHLLEIEKFHNRKRGYSDIDGYLIVNAVNLISRCDLRGLLIVGSDKDYLPVFMMAKYKAIRSRLFGVNIPEIYDEYDVQHAPFLETLSEVFKDRTL